MKKKIGLACATLNNYGSLLQTYALQVVVNKEGINTEIIRYHEPVSRKIKRLKDFEYFKVIVKKVLLNNLPFFGSRADKKKLIGRAKCFDSFREDNLSFSKTCRSHKELTALSLSYNMVLLGSDQLWQPMNLLMDFYTLTFVPKGVIKATYAASFGVSEIPERMEDKYKNFIGEFDYLSCREEAGATLVKELTGREAQVVCDPTLLLTAEDWNLAMPKQIKIDKGYILCYFLGANENHRRLTKEWSKEKGLRIIALPHIVEYVACDEAYADDLQYQVGPSEFLYLIKNASYVFTDSFHASVFSLVFHKQFFVFDRFENHKGRATTSRIETLLNIVSHKERLVRHNASIGDIQKMKDIDFSQTDDRLENFRAHSHKYLKSVLQSI